MFYFRLAPDVSLVADRKFTTLSANIHSGCLFMFLVVGFFRNDCPLLLSDSHTGHQCAPPFLFVWPFPDSTHRTSVCSFYVDLEFFVKYDTVKLLPTFSPVLHFLRFALAFRTRRHTPSPVVANAPPPPPFFFLLGFLRCVFQSYFSHFPACATDSRVFFYFFLFIATDRTLRFLA